MPYHATTRRLLPLLLLAFVLILQVTPLVAQAQLIPECDPSKPITEDSPIGSPDGKTPCGIYAFARFITNAINWLLAIAIPIAVAMIGWGGVQILISAGNPSTRSAGIGKVKTALIGLIIMFLAWVIVRAVFMALGVIPAFTPEGLQ